MLDKGRLELFTLGKVVEVLVVVSDVLVGEWLVLLLAFDLLFIEECLNLTKGGSITFLKLQQQS